MLRGHPLKGLLEDTIYRVGEAGLWKKWWQDYQLNLPTKEDYLVNVLTAAPLDMSFLWGNNCNLIFGLIVSLIVFVMEVIRYVFFKH